MNVRPRVVIAAPNYWTSPLHVGSHAIARTFVELGWNVAYLSDPISPLHIARLGTPATRVRFRLWLRGGQLDLSGRLFASVPGTLVSPRALPKRLGGVAAGWISRTVPGIRRVLAEHGFDHANLTWIDSVVFERLPDLIPTDHLVLRIADRASGFPRHSATLDAMERRLAQRADLVAFSARTLEAHAGSLGAKRTIYMPNGVDLSRFAHEADEPTDLATIPRPRAIYAGALEAWFDFDGLAALATALPNVSFVLIGPDALARRRLVSSPNLHLMGARPPAMIPAYLQHADVGLIPFDLSGHRSLVEAVHPVKLYEYLAAGLPVVARRWRELELLASPALLYETLEEAVLAIRAALGATDLRPFQEWVATASWRGRLTSVLGELGLRT